jgi:hypothetical protein
MTPVDFMERWLAKMPPELQPAFRKEFCQMVETFFALSASKLSKDASKAASRLARARWDRRAKSVPNPELGPKR